MFTACSFRTQRRYHRVLFFSAFLVVCWFALTGTTGGEYIRILLDFQLQPNPHAHTDTDAKIVDENQQQSSSWEGLDAEVFNTLVIPEEKESVSSRSHVFREDGLVEVNLNSPHPIFEMMEHAERDWNNKLAKASTTLEQAVTEYRRRYKRDPPKGFDKWWAYVERHQVLLPDEYDMIYEDLEPFWGLDPMDLQQIHDELESKVDSYTLGKESNLDKIKVLRTSFHEGANYEQLIHGSKGILDLLDDIQDELPPFRATFSPHDNPNRLNDYGVLSTVLQAASTNNPIPESELPQRQENLYWLSACSPNSTARKMPTWNLDGPAPLSSPSGHKTLIYNHKLAMDPCLHPRLFWKHGQLLSHHYGPHPQPHPIPEFSLCSTTLHGDIRFPSPYSWVEDAQGDREWEDKIDERLGWRGTTTGIFANDLGKTRWRDGHRFRPVQMAAEIEGELEVLMTPTTTTHHLDEHVFKKKQLEVEAEGAPYGYGDHGYEEDRQTPLGQPRKFRKSLINPALMDLAFAGDPNTCEPSTCQTIRSSYAFRLRQSDTETFRYKYLLDVDGNGWSGRFKRLITSNSLVFKATMYPEWFVDRIQPWVHYVPVQLGMEDLYDVFMFFRGDLCGKGGHEELGKKIAKQGKEWSKKFWRREDLVAYFYRLILEYVRVISLDREGMSFHLEGDSEDVAV
ncbi:hypothetical protein K435DRAFT_818824 [Dendrothele bispora CBS 962.96]|uniref:Glycosyl transferase CAP10 domain-containing protein n=1 Tax=Dendrothele bispora (strain CBS 962.96) TaxID=1314807 RepID=A0A4S8M8U6_DENBC|nr:hypothetical protein K435DRAFT_818824 [Dendrothele bispora CBS 962.96]